MTQRAQYDTTISGQILFARLAGFFGFLAVVLVATGLYGTLAYRVNARTAEIGVRMALGASRFDILRLILREGVRLIALGTAVGIVAALVMSQLLRSLLYQVGPRDPASFIMVTLLLALVALAATLVPARSAMKTDPMQALRCE